jgi:hypothetical protein
MLMVARLLPYLMGITGFALFPPIFQHAKYINITEAMSTSTTWYVSCLHHVRYM